MSDLGILRQRLFYPALRMTCYLFSSPVLPEPCKATRRNSSSRTALAVVMAARGYPGEPLRGSRIEGIKDADMLAGVVVLHGGTREVGGVSLRMGGEF